MRHNRFYIFTLLALLALNGCIDKETLETEKPVADIESYVIGTNEMLSNLSNYCKELGTKSQNVNDDIEEIFVVGHPVITRSSSTSDTLLYVINYKNNRGYAIMSADRRIREDMLMVTDTGRVSLSDFEILVYDGSGNSPLDTIDIYDEENDDYLIGGRPESTEKYILQKVQEYASNSVNKNSIDTPYTDIDDNPYIVTIGNDRPDTWVDRVNTHRDTVTAVEPMLITRWSQSSPYNDLVPNKRYTGCVTNAIGQIMAYEQFPQTFYANGVYIHWESLTEKATISPDTQAATMVAALLRLIQHNCNSLRFKEGTFAFPKYAEKFLKDVGYTNVSRQKSYDTEVIKQSLRKGHPVFLAGSDGWWLWDVISTGHAWLVDGLKNVYEEYDLVDHKTGEYIRTERHLLWDHVHCVWGSASSWVVNGVFENDGTVYTDWKRMITYDL